MWLPCQVPGMVGSVPEPAGPVSLYTMSWGTPVVTLPGAWCCWASARPAGPVSLYELGYLCGYPARCLVWLAQCQTCWPCVIIWIGVPLWLPCQVPGVVGPVPDLLALCHYIVLWVGVFMWLPWQVHGVVGSVPDLLALCHYIVLSVPDLLALCHYIVLWVGVFMWLPCQVHGVVGPVLDLLALDHYILWVGDIASLICTFSVAARETVGVDPSWDALAFCWDVKQPTDDNWPPRLLTLWCFPCRCCCLLVASPSSNMLVYLWDQSA